MKILAINASYRGNQGYTRVLLDKLVKGATAAGGDCEIVTLTRYKINHCLGCDKCQTKEHYLTCVQNDADDVQKIFQKMAEADLLIFATPVYVLGISPLLKMLLDRTYGICDCGKLILTKNGLLFHHTDRNVGGKPFAAVICYDNLENATPSNCISYFNTYARYMDVRLAGVLVRNAGRLAAHGQDPSREQIFPKLREVHKAYEQAGFELAKRQYISRSTQRTANQEIIPVKFFGLLKHFGPFKKVFLKRANSMMAAIPGA